MLFTCIKQIIRINISYDKKYYCVSVQIMKFEKKVCASANLHTDAT